MALGLCGLAGTWTAAGRVGSPPIVAGLLWWAGAVAWLTATARYVRAGIQASTVLEDLRHPVSGAFAGLPPIAGSLLAARLAGPLPRAGEALVWCMAALSAVFGAWFVAQLLTRPRSAESVNGGYLLPTVAASFVSAQSLASTGHLSAARTFFACGLLFWLLIGALLLTRLATGPRLPTALLPTLAVFSAPPAVAGNAWWSITSGPSPAARDLLLSLMAGLLLPQLFLIPAYLRLPVSLGLWSFTFTAAASATYGVRSLAILNGPPGTALSWIVVGSATVVVGGIAVLTLVLPLFPRLRGTPAGSATPAGRQEMREGHV